MLLHTRHSESPLKRRQVARVEPFQSRKEAYLPLDSYKRQILKCRPDDGYIKLFEELHMAQNKIGLVNVIGCPVGDGFAVAYALTPTGL